MTQDELKALIGQMNGEMDNALATLAQLATQAKYMEAHIAAGAQAILATLAAPYEDPRDTTVEITAGTPVEQHSPSPLGA
jgi:hypothetical protein